jgi:hypothetical protein
MSLGFFHDQFPPDPIVSHWGHRKFFRKFAEIFSPCAAHIGMGGVKIKKEPRQQDEYVYRIS